MCLLTCLFSCNRDDDFDALFYGRTWYMLGAKINGQVLNSEVKGFYAYGSEAYQISFTANTFIGTLSSGVTFAGNWTGDKSKRTLEFNVTQQPTTSLTFDKNIFGILKSVAYYKGDENVMTIYADEDNYINLNYIR